MHIGIGGLNGVEKLLRQVGTEGICHTDVCYQTITEERPAPIPRQVKYLVRDDQVTGT
jgi:hypothetical protein